MNIAFLGLGNMGRPMAINLHKAGHTVRAFDVFDKAREQAAAEGLTVSATAAEAVQGADVVISMMPAGKHVLDAFTGEGALLKTMTKGALLIDCSTISDKDAIGLAQSAQGMGIACIDAPVSGGTAGAAAGTLSFMVGGSTADFERARPVLQQMGKNIFHAGANGAGQVAKMCNNMLLAILMVGTSEALALGQANGLDPKALSEIMRLSSGGNWVLEKYNPVPGVMESTPASRGYSGGFGTALMLKDLGLAMANADASGLPTALGHLVQRLYQQHHDEGHQALDFSSVIQTVEKKG